MAIKIVTEYQWNRLKIETLNTAFTILETVEVLIEHTRQRFNVKPSVPIICTALYTHAIEECGKLFYLRTLIPQNGMVEIEYDRKFKFHTPKFDLALDCLPERCTNLYTDNYGTNFGANFGISTVADWETRLTILNTDFYDNGEVKRYPRVELAKLQEAVFNFRTVLYSIKTD